MKTPLLCMGSFRGYHLSFSCYPLSGTFIAVGSVTTMFCSTCHVPFAATQIKSKWFGTSLRQLFFYYYYFMCCFLLFSHFSLFCLLSLNCRDSQGHIITFLPGEIKEGLLEAWLSLFLLKKNKK